MGTENDMHNISSARFLAALALAFALAGCGGFNGANEAQDSPADNHPITVSADMQTLSVAASRGKNGLTDDERRAVAGFAAAYKERGHGPLTVSAPSGSANTAGAMNTLVEVRDILTETGIPADRIGYTPYRPSGADGEPPLILSYKRYVATPSPCGDWSLDYAKDPANGIPPNFGCASQNNLAVLVAEPADLVQPRTMTPSDVNRRATVFDKYRKGEITAAERSEDESGKVSEVGQ